jgi:murein tripeptide amidase MpaA
MKPDVTQVLERPVRENAGSAVQSVHLSGSRAAGRSHRRAAFSFPTPVMMRQIVRAALLGSAMLISSMLPPGTGVATAQQAAAVMSPREFLGYELGAEFTPHAGVRDYMRALADASPRVDVSTYGRTPEGRDLIQVVIADPGNHARLGQILELNAELARAGTTEERARVIAAGIPAVLYFSYGVHGNESSSSEAAMWTAYDLAIGSGDVGSVLDSLVLIIDPVANPDGRDRYVNWYRSVVGESPNASPRTREHSEPWPGGRYNHYLFDLNRDWAWMTQPETRARLATWWRWNPQVHVDFHEMSPTSTYFFFPAAAPINPIYPDHILEWGRRFGEANAGAFDAHGWTYFTGESYDLLYPGYGDTWPSLLGAVGMTYEQAGGGSAGLRYARAEGDTLTLERRASQHRAAANATLRAAAAGRTRLLLDFAQAHRTAGSDVQDFLLVPGTDPSRFEALVSHLGLQGIAVERATGPLRIAATAYPGYTTRREFPPGTALVRARQPRGRLAATLLQPVTELRGDFSYDITAWSLPYAYGVEAHRTGSAPRSGWSDVPIGVARGSLLLPPSGYGYLVAPTELSAPAVLRYLVNGGVVRVLARSTTFAGREWPAGSWFLPTGAAGAESRDLESAGLGEFAVPVFSGMSQAGIDLGSGYARPVRLPRVALIGGEGVAASSYGAHWFHLEQQLGFPFDPILLRDLTSLELDRYDVIVIPETSGSLTDEVLEALRVWTDAGGRLIAVGDAAEAVASIAEIELREESGDEEDDSTALERLLATREEREQLEFREDIPGAILPVRLDPGHPLAWGAAFDGVPDRLFVLHTEGRVFEPRVGAETVASFGEELQATAGHVSESNLRRMERSAWLISRDVGSGRVILFADDPLFRLFWHSTMPLYRNALLYGGM